MIDPVLIIILLLLIGGITIPLVIHKRHSQGIGAAPSLVLPADPYAASRTNGLAIASLIVVFFSSLVGLILGHVALSQIKRTGEGGHGLALAAVTIGWIFTAVAIIGIIILTVMSLGALSSLHS